MAAPMKMDDSSSEDEETLAKLKEAAVESSSFIKETSSKTHVETNRKLDKKEQNSLRPDKQVATQVYSSVIETTPGTKKYIAKKLSAALDSEIDTSGSCFYPAGLEVPLETTGVKLFHHSTSYISFDEESNNAASRPKRRRLPSSSTDSSEDEKLAEAAVSHDFVMKQSSLPCYTDNKPPDVTIVTGSTLCVKEVTSQISASEPDKNNGRCEKSSVDSDEGTDSVKHHKKKKKNKHKHRKSVEEG